MTTIAIDKTTIAWDSLYILGDSEKMNSPTQKVIKHKGVIFASSGDAFGFEPFIDHYLNQAKVPKGSWELIVIDEGKILYCNNSAPVLQPVTAPFAIGSGSQYARAIMMDGGNARRAVKIAIACDAHSGGEIKSLRFGKKRAKSKVNRKG